MITQVYKSRRSDVEEHIRQMREMTKTATEHEMKSLVRRATPYVIEVGIEVMALLQCEDPDNTTKEILSGSDPSERDTIDASLLDEAPEVHRRASFSKHLLNTIYTSSINNIAPYIFGNGDDDMYKDWLANQFVCEYSRHTGVPPLEAREPCNVLMYSDARGQEPRTLQAAAYRVALVLPYKGTSDEPALYAGCCASLNNGLCCGDA